MRALRLPSGAWVGTGEDPVDAGGTLPGCWPTREQVHGNANPVYVITGFDYQEADIDARSSGGSFWRIQFGRVDVPGAVRVTDLVSGRSARVADGHLFALAIPYSNPGGLTPLHLVAYGSGIVADDRRYG